MNQFENFCPRSPGHFNIKIRSFLKTEIRHRRPIGGESGTRTLFRPNTATPSGFENKYRLGNEHFWADGGSERFGTGARNVQK